MFCDWNQSRKTDPFSTDSKREVEVVLMALESLEILVLRLLNLTRRSGEKILEKSVDLISKVYCMKSSERRMASCSQYPANWIWRSSKSALVLIYSDWKKNAKAYDHLRINLESSMISNAWDRNYDSIKETFNF